ncbi:NAD(P)H-dependent FMN reductase [Actinoalloteichus hoggarensis]|uniref:FMN-dependent NADPH-azoreductase n=1 Tax=Actinoalloteichus hoggarensis TaxID=1470176 RepID=A0A221VVW7_9PSEU|nr:NAD(P)H-dependent oxidoreductase [Actinoalloteichus hoggarensis]ASO17690.1 FMN-dependent NADPH-azoreductase [Actinoalloteichus hoggarensis]MBB5922815.1 NAD(P)H-dependent FMN reductase [Actinoalloteichus hoggarensis]
MTAVEPLRLTIIIGSTRRGRLGPSVADWFKSRVADHGAFDADVIDLAEIGLPDVLVDEADDIPVEVTETAPRLAAADAHVVITPEYNHSFPAPLKTAIDWFFDEWAAKPVGFVSYGGVSGGLRAVEQLRLVFAELHAVDVRNSVSFADISAEVEVDGRRSFENERADAAAVSLLDQLDWWAHALAQAREARPYRP